MFFTNYFQSLCNQFLVFASEIATIAMPEFRKFRKL